MGNETLFSVYRRKAGRGAPPLEWAIRRHGKGIEIRSGTSGRPVRGNTADPSWWKSRSAWATVRALRDEKRQQGFALVGFGDYPNDRLRLAYEWDPERDRDAVAAATLRWRTRTAIEPAPFEALMARIVQGLTLAGVAARTLGAGTDERPGLAAQTPAGEWAISLQPDGELTDRGREGPGRVQTHSGTVPMITLLRIEREFPGTIEFIRFEDRTAIRMSPEIAPNDTWLGVTAAPYETTLRMAQTVGLMPGLMLTGINENDGPKPMWF